MYSRSRKINRIVKNYLSIYYSTKIIHSVSTFERKVDNFKQDIASKALIHFLTLLEYKNNYSKIDIAAVLNFMSDFRKEFAAGL